MSKFITTFAVLLVITGCAKAQEADHHAPVLGYVFVGDASHSMGLAAGFGGALSSRTGLGVGLELGDTGFTRPGDIHYNSYTMGVGSADVMYHYYPKQANLRMISPFVAFGYNALFGHTSLSGGEHTNGFDVGAGLDLFATKHLGFRLDTRYYGHGGTLFKNTYPGLAEFTFVAVRFALTFK